MKAFTTQGDVSVSPTDNVVSALLSRAETAPDHPALAYRSSGGFVDISTAAFAAEVREVAAGIVALGLEPGTRISLFSATRWEFTLFDYAIWASGCAAVTIYESSSAQQVEWIVGNSDSQMIICETEAHRAVFDSVAGRVADCSTAFVIEDGAVGQLKALATDEARAEVDRRVSAIKHGDLASLVYTSGTTGKPKGCVLTHGNFIWESRQLEVMAPQVINARQRQLMFLPLAHVWARLVEVACVSSGVTIYYSTGIPQLMEEMAIVKPTWVFSVPRVFEKIYNAAKQKADSEGKGRVFDRAVRVAIDYSTTLDSTGPGPWTRLQHALFDRLVYAKLRAVLGGEAEYAFSGGAPLGVRLAHFFRGIGITALEGYGLTETTAGATQNTPDAMRIGSVGRPFPGTSIKIADDGEVMIKGGQIFSGYWKNAAATEEALEPDGWFHSGDLGEIDDDGFLSITGRKKEIIVTAGGKNVAPAVLEDRIRAHPLISQVVVVGEAKPFIAALVTIDEDFLPAWASANGKTGTALADLVDDSDLNAAVQSAIDDGNNAVSRAEAIKTYRVLPQDLTIEAGELTPTLKVRREIVARKYEAVIADIYA
ncbi:MAG: long-chain fatty acid--CoA ligase [Actinomycetota bacterium]